MSPTEPITTTKTETYRHHFLGTLALLVALAAAGLLVVVLYARPAEANYPGKPGKIAYAGYDGNDDEVYTIKPDGGAGSRSPTTARIATILPTRPTARGSPIRATTATTPRSSPST